MELGRRVLWCGRMDWLRQEKLPMLFALNVVFSAIWIVKLQNALNVEVHLSSSCTQLSPTGFQQMIRVHKTLPLMISWRILFRSPWQRHQFPKNPPRRASLKPYSLYSWISMRWTHGVDQGKEKFPQIRSQTAPGRNFISKGFNISAFSAQKFFSSFIE